MEYYPRSQHICKLLYGQGCAHQQRPQQINLDMAQIVQLQHAVQMVGRVGLEDDMPVCATCGECIADGGRVVLARAFGWDDAGFCRVYCWIEYRGSGQGSTG